MPYGAVMGLFDAMKHALEVARDLVGAGFMTRDISVLGPGSRGIAALVRMGVLEGDAALYGEQLGRGNILLSVHVETWPEQARARLILARNGGHHLVVVE